MEQTLDRMESQGLDFLRRVRGGFLKEAQRARERIVVIDADRSVDAVQEDIQLAVRNRLE